MAYRVIVAPAAVRIIAKLPRDIRRRIADRLAALSDDPRPPGSAKLAGKDAYRIRVGDYRIVYTIHDKELVVIVIDAGHRREVYRKR